MTIDSDRSVSHLHEDEDVHGVVVLAERPRDEAVVVRVHDGRIEDAVHLDEPRLLVQLVLHLAPLGDLHDLLDTPTGSDIQASDLQVATLVAGEYGIQILTTLKTAGASGPAN